MLGRTDIWSYRIPFAIQWVWPIPLFCAILFAPESPWYLVRKGRIDQAKKSLEILTSKEEKENLDRTLAMMVHTTELEQAVARKNTESSYFDCFKGTDLRRTEIVCMVYAVPVSCGDYINTIYFLEQAGMLATDAFDLGLGQNGLALVGTALSWVLMSYLGRRTLYLVGITILGTILFIVGCLSLAPAAQKGPLWAQGILFMIFIFSYDLMIGPVCFSLVAELSSTRLRQRSIVLARNVYNLIGLAASTILPYQMNQTAWNWIGKLGFFWFGSCLLCFIWIYFRLPEPKGRTFAELDMLFEMRVAARKFKTTMVDPYDLDQVEILVGEYDEKVNST
jgi:SP family general alpha glucoside:H+ symporter-like MFS transporter